MPPTTDRFTLILTFIISSCLVMLIWIYRLPIAAYIFKGEINAIPASKPNTKPGYGSEIEVMADSRGHYFLDANVDRTTVNFMIDTGASFTVLSYSDAKRLGLVRDLEKTTVSVQTGAGTVQMFRATLPYVEIGQIRIDRLDALVAPEGAMAQSVLGMNFLNRLNSYKFEQRKMTLVP